MPLRLSPLALVIVLAAAVLTDPAAASRMGRYSLNPKTYSSPSGQFRLHVDPGTLYGQGPGRYRLSRGDREVWAKELPFTLWDAAVTDEGLAAGYAYSLGKENYPLQRDNAGEGRLHVVILDPRGELRLNAVFPRRGAYTCTSDIDRDVDGLVLDPDNDRLLVRMSEGGWSARTETWRIYRLATGELVDEFQFAHPQESECEYWRLLAVSAVPGTPFVLTNWSYTKYDETDNHPQARGGRFALLEPGGEPVWKLDRPDDYPDYYEYSKRLDREKNQAEFDRLLQLERRIDHGGGAILPSTHRRAFDVWFVREQQRVTFEVAPEADGSWRVAETGRTPLEFEVETATSQPALPEMTLTHLGAIRIETAAAPAPDIRDISYFDVDDRGRIGFLRKEADRSTTFVLVDPSGKLAWTYSLAQAFGPDYYLEKANWISGDRWLLVADLRHEVPGQDKEPTTHAWWLDAAAHKLSEITPFAAQDARHIARTPAGGFVAYIEPDLGSDAHEIVAAFDPDGQELWRSVPAAEEGITFGTTFVAALATGEILVERRYGSALTLLSSEGKFLTTAECEEMFGQDSARADCITADYPDGALVAGHYPQPTVWRIDRDGHVRARLTLKHPDGRPVRLIGFPDQIGLRATADGALWACDGNAFFRIDPDGTVGQTLGESPDLPELSKIASVHIDQRGQIYAAEERNGIVHVFDQTGRRHRLLRPNPDDFPKSWDIGRISVAGDGAVLVGKLEFSPEGERVGFRSAPEGLDAEEVRWHGSYLFQPGSRRTWLIGSEAVHLVDENNRLARSIDRRVNRDWLDRIDASAVAPDGALAVAAGEFGMQAYWERRADTINIYTPDGEPRCFADVPDFRSGFINYDALAFSGRWVVAAFWADAPRLLLLDTAAHPPRWYSLALSPMHSPQSYHFTKNGAELWTFADGRVERFALPVDQPETTPPTETTAPGTAAP